MAGYKGTRVVGEGIKRCQVSVRVVSLGML